MCLGAAENHAKMLATGGLGRRGEEHGVVEVVAKQTVPVQCVSHPVIAPARSRLFVERPKCHENRVV